MLPFRELNRQEPEKWLSDHTAALKRLMKTAEPSSNLVLEDKFS